MKSRFTTQDCLYMQQAIKLAQNALHVSPNPPVGAVLVSKQKIVSKASHQGAGTLHAEIAALKKLKKIPKDSVLYLTLEPCVAHDKKRMPPCANALIESGISKVFIGCKDPNPQVSGRGIALLKKAGISVEFGCLKEECENLIVPFAYWMKHKLPYITLKMAMTLDGKIADAKGKSQWISGEGSRKIVQKLRAENDAILVGAETVIADDASLTVRDYKNINPLRVVVDKDLKTKTSLKVFQQLDKAKTLVVTQEKFTFSSKVKKMQAMGLEFVFLKTQKGHFIWKDLWSILANKNIARVLVEGGAGIASSLIKQKQVNELHLFVAPKLLGASALSAFEHLKINSLSQAIPFKIKSYQSVGQDIYLRFMGNI